MWTLRSFLQGRWIAGQGPATVLVDPATHEPVAEVSSAGLDLRAALHHARSVGGPALRAKTFAERAAILDAHGTGPVHVHAAEQTKEVEDCLTWSGARPVQWLIEHAAVDRRWCLIHATHMTEQETADLAASGGVAGLCPLTEANLGDGIFNGVAYHAARGRWGIGSDSHIRVCAAEELRLLEYGQRLRDRSRNVFAGEGQSTGRLLYDGALAGGAQALQRPAGSLAIGQVADLIALDPEHPALAGRQGDALLDSWIFCGDRSCVRHVWVAGRQLVTDGRHLARDGAAKAYAAAMARVLA